MHEKKNNLSFIPFGIKKITFDVNDFFISNYTSANLPNTILSLMQYVHTTLKQTVTNSQLE